MLIHAIRPAERRHGATGYTWQTSLHSWMRTCLRCHRILETYRIRCGRCKVQGCTNCLHRQADETWLCLTRCMGPNHVIVVESDSNDEDDAPKSSSNNGDHHDSTVEE